MRKNRLIIIAIMISFFSFFVGINKVQAASCASGFTESNGYCNRIVSISCGSQYSYNSTYGKCFAPFTNESLMWSYIRNNYGSQYNFATWDSSGYIFRIGRPASSGECPNNPNCYTFNKESYVTKSITKSSTYQFTCFGSKLEGLSVKIASGNAMPGGSGRDSRCQFQLTYSKQLSSCSKIDLSSYPSDAKATKLDEMRCKISYKKPSSSSGGGSGSGGGSISGGGFIVNISNATISSIANQKYNGGAVKPAVTVKYNGKTLKSGTDYTVSYSNNTSVGTATAKVIGKGNYTGSKSVKFKILAVITYKANGGTGSDVTQTIEMGQSTKLKPYSTFKKEGYFIKEWNTKANGTGVSWTIQNTNDKGYKWDKKKNVTLYAIWDRITVTYNANGGSAVDSKGKKYTTWSEKVPTNGKYYLKDNFYTYKGYEFVGWNEKKNGTGTDWTAWYANNYKKNNLKYWQWNYKTYPKSVTLYAIWKKSKFTVKFNANGGTGTMADQSIDYGSSFTLRKNTFTKEGYEFIGWQDTSGAVWDDEFKGVWKYDNGSYGITNKTLTLKALWRDPNAEADVIDGNYIKVEVYDTPTKFSKRRGFKSYNVYNRNNQSRDKTSKFKTGDKFDITTKNYIVIVIGDVNGDGESNVTDIIQIYNKMKGNTSFDEIKMEAADMDNNTDIGITDIIKIYAKMADRR